jgi:hypothetical protein
MRSISQKVYVVSSILLPYFEKAGRNNRDDFRDNFETLLTGKGNLKQIARDERPLVFLYELLEHLSELEESFATLADCSRLYRSCPKLPKGVTIARFRKLLHEAHLEEIYIFINRIDSCITFLQRAYARDPELEKVGVLGSELRTIVKDKFSDIILIRGTHTHKVRLSHILEDHRRILFLESLVSTKSDPNLQGMLKQARQQFQQEARSQLHKITLGAKDALAGMTDLLMFYIEKNCLFQIPRRYATYEKQHQQHK